MAVAAPNSIWLDSISITSPPSKTDYKAGETFNTSGMVVKAQYTNGTVIIAKDIVVTGWNVTPSGALEAGRTSVTVQYTEGGVTKTATQAITVTRTALTVPSQSGSLTYSGSAQSPSWSNYDSGKMTLGGTTSGANAGSYNATFTLKNTDLYCWSDGSLTAKTVSWSIGKAAGTLSLSKSSITLQSGKLSDTFTITTNSSGAISVSSSNTGVATVSLSGTTATVTSVNSTTGNVTITVSVAADTNHTAPANATVSVAAKFVSTTLSENGWDTIKSISDAGTGANYWSVGDTKSITINGKAGNFTFSNYTVDAFIIGFNHNSAKEGSNRIHFLIGKSGGKLVGLCDSQYGNEQTSSGYFHMNTSRTNVGGWNASAMRKNLLGNSGTPTSPTANTLLAALSSDLRAVMKSVTKYTDNTGNASNVSGNVTATSDYLFLLAEFEVQGSRSYANQYEQNSQAQYDYFKAGNSKIAYRHTATGTAVWWWLRSARYYGSTGFCSVFTDGGANYNVASWSAGVLPGFAV